MHISDMVQDTLSATYGSRASFVRCYTQFSSQSTLISRGTIYVGNDRMHNKSSFEIVSQSSRTDVAELHPEPAQLINHVVF